MRYAVLADIHANLTALEAVLRDIESRGGIEDIWCLGDIVGYGPDPCQCLALIRKTCSFCLAGNHDWAAAGKLDLLNFNSDAAAAARWTHEQLSRPETSYLGELPLLLEKDKVTLAHGSPRDSIWEYILSSDAAGANFACFQTPYCLVGHSHLPLLFEQGPYHNEALNPSAALRPAVGRYELSDGQTILMAEKKMIVNPGSVGQPRDNDPRASYGIYDSQSCTFTLRRVRYDIGAVQQRMAQAGLPAWLIERLSFGR
jgi:diadenosine tetraphosphatase ApaH/serine/threonine PP2A family protein phosphatase